MKIYGLLGRNIDYSFSRKYFAEKFQRENISAEYHNFDLEKVGDVKKVLKGTPELSGLNVTIPYKQEIMPFLDRLDTTAAEIGAVNTIKIEEDNSLTGFNTDYYGFKASLEPYLTEAHRHALILGTGGASKAVAYALQELGIEYKYVSRHPDAQQLNYNQLNKEFLQQYKLIINCTPLGTFPRVENYPGIPFQHLNEEHLVYDLIYNPEVTALMQRAAEKGAKTLNGLRMLELQAEKAWEVWNS